MNTETTKTVKAIVAVILLSILTATLASAAEPVVNINEAELAELAYLPRIGTVKAQAIIDARPYATPVEVVKAKGIGPATMAVLGSFIVTDGATTATAKIVAPTESIKISVAAGIAVDIGGCSDGVCIVTFSATDGRLAEDDLKITHRR